MKKNKRIKIRMHSWYWGNYCTFPSGKDIPKDFELYTEEEHGWHHSEEFSKGQKTNEFSKPIRHEDL